MRTSRKQTSVRNLRVSSSRQRKQQHLLDVKVRSRKATQYRNRRILVFFSKIVLVLALLRYVPVIGWLAGLAVASLAIGAVVQTRFGTRDAAPSGPMPPGRTDGGA